MFIELHCYEIAVAGFEGLEVMDSESHSAEIDGQQALNGEVTVKQGIPFICSDNNIM